MSSLARILVNSGQRVDLMDLKSIDSYTMGDFKYLIQSFVGNQKPYILKGFEVINPSTCIGSKTLSVKISDSVVYFPTSTAGPFFFGLEAGNPIAADISPTLIGTSNGTIVNYIYLTLSTEDGVPDIRSFWNKLLNGGAGGEYSQLVNTETYLIAEVAVSTAGFPDNTVPICQVQVSNNIITWIQDCRDLMFRLGTGGLSPNIYNTFNFPNLPASTYAREETPIIIDGVTSTVTPFPSYPISVLSPEK